MIGIEKGMMTTSTMINEVNTMTPRQNDLVVKKEFWVGCLKANLEFFFPQWKQVLLGLGYALTRIR